ncbi:uncharacterized protein TRIVIDRAFT_66987 [Trichoderma virens Gv29-8]|uniref:Uncharacterized protein n=1 Tax=Hypocrea virens (strain Gv29-8 / FGSC 10586) TaxID=413071 RepID=G9N2Q3_HYPVG|nr:uncharacterized protein TRIVIDRAFT_66987 [Trichoderma virens Gv29-8]EHK18967.1 hypothetical protein TRIVIDRAFT_66987 [Trichoderma virens Gv29-8]UKZ56741.1 hypothetical protein TrVGV298_010582 [Trichoderma virens]
MAQTTKPKTAAKAEVGQRLLHGWGSPALAPRFCHNPANQAAAVAELQRLRLPLITPKEPTRTDNCSPFHLRAFGLNLEAFSTFPFAVLQIGREIPRRHMTRTKPDWGDILLGVHEAQGNGRNGLPLVARGFRLFQILISKSRYDIEFPLARVTVPDRQVHVPYLRNSTCSKKARFQVGTNLLQPSLNSVASNEKSLLDLHLP